MRVVQLTVTPDADGVLRFAIPAGPGVTGPVEAAVVLTPAPTANGTHPAKTPEELGWPPGYFENVVGSIDDETFMRHPQPEYPPPVSLE
jgi:hypothetical protein